MNQCTDSRGFAGYDSLKLKYFDELAQVSNSLNTTLKSYYSYKRALCETNIASKSNEIKPNKTPLKCCRCNFYFADTLAQHYVRPGIRNTRFAKKIMKQHAKGSILTKYQSEYLKNMETSRSNKMIIVCSFCNHNNAMPMSKPRDLKPYERYIQDAEIVSSAINTLTASRKRKKKRKDKYCGLDSGVVSRVTEKSLQGQGFIPLDTQIHTLVKKETNSPKNNNKETLSSSNSKHLHRRNTNKSFANVNTSKNKNSQQLTRNMSTSKIKNAKTKKTLKMKISNMLNIVPESTNTSSLQNLLKSS